MAKDTAGKPSELVLATRNQHKIKELSALLADMPLKLASLLDYPDVGSPAETGTSFEENAVAKATFAAYCTKKVSLADDSGLEVDALGGAPGLLSSRYAGDDATDWDKMQKVLTELTDANKSSRTARFRCAIAMCDPTGRIEVFEGRCEGWISLMPLGADGFGYDPIFVVPDLEKTMAELVPEVKNTVSHRARAMRKAKIALADLLGIEYTPPSTPDPFGLAGGPSLSPPKDL